MEYRDESVVDEMVMEYHDGNVFEEKMESPVGNAFESESVDEENEMQSGERCDWEEMEYRGGSVLCETESHAREKPEDHAGKVTEYHDGTVFGEMEFLVGNAFANDDVVETIHDPAGNAC